MISASAITRANKLWQMCFSPAEHEANVARTKLFKWIQEQRAHPTDIRLAITDPVNPERDRGESLLWKLKDDYDLAQQQIDTLIAENDHLRDFIKQQLGGQALADIGLETRRTVAQQQWKEFHELVRTRLFENHLTADWRAKVAAHFEVTLSRLRSWERGDTIIPTEVMQQLRQRPSPDRVSSLKQPWTKEQITVAAELLFSGESDTAVYDRQLGIMLREVKHRFSETRPPYDLDIKVEHEGPTTWYELWEIGTTLCGRVGWRSKILFRLGSTKDFGFTHDPNQHIDPALLDQVRQQYHARSPWSVFRQETNRLLAEGTLVNLKEMRTRLKNNGIAVMPKLIFELALRYNHVFGPTFTMTGEPPKATRKRRKKRSADTTGG